MKFSVFTLFPEIVQAYASSSIFKRAQEKGLIGLETIDFRDFAQDKHRSADDSPYGGGAGMVLKPEPLGDALDRVKERKPGLFTIYMTPAGKTLDQKMARELSRLPELGIICGRYEGVDQRIRDSRVDLEVSIGDYVLASGEVAAMVLMDSVFRLVDGVLNPESLAEESHDDGLLEYPHYTKPQVYGGMPVPEVLQSGNHGLIDYWRTYKRVEATVQTRGPMGPGDHLQNKTSAFAQLEAWKGELYGSHKSS